MARIVLWRSPGWGRIVVLVTLGCCLGLTAATPPSEPWIRAEDPVAAYWTWTVDADADRVVGEPLYVGEPYRHILLLAGKRSPSYDQTLGRFCRNLHAAGIAVHWTCALAESDAAVAALMADLATGLPCDLVLSVGTEALTAIHRHPPPRDLPVVTTTCKNPSRLGFSPVDGSPAGGSVAYTSLNVPPALQLRYLQRLLPDLRCLVICVNRRRSRVLQAEVEPLRDRCRQEGITTTLLAIDGPEAVAQQIQELAPAALAAAAAVDPDRAHSAWWISSCTALFDQVATLQALAPDLPVLSENPDLVCDSSAGNPSAMAAIGIDRRNNAHLASLYAIDILLGRVAPGALPLGVADPPDIALNLQRLVQHDRQVPFGLIERASFIYDEQGRVVRRFGRLVATRDPR